MITRHILTLGSGRRVHYRRCGAGPVLLMVHQSPRSSAEYEPLMRRWGAHFTCIAPDTPGFGQSDPLADPLHPAHVGEPEIGDFADALAEFLAALGVKRCAAYGFHSGGIILVTALKRHPDLFSGLAIGGYAIWTAREMAVFGEHYLPPFRPSAYGEHLTWLWNRMLEQSWFFPWFALSDQTRLSIAHADLARVHQAVMEMLDAGDAYRAGYGAVLRAPRDIPVADDPASAGLPPCLITAYDGDPLQEHIDRLGPLPAGWEAHKVTSPAEHQAASLAFLRQHAASQAAPALAEDQDEGWLVLDDRLLHWRGTRGAERMMLHPPADELADPPADAVAIDVPGHGLSDDFDDTGAAIREAMAQLGAAHLAAPPPPPGDPSRLYPDLTPERFGAHLAAAWGAARGEAIFAPWYAASTANAIPVQPALLEPAAIARRARARLRAKDAAPRYHAYLKQRKGATQP